MSVKTFFKGTTFRCILALLSIALVSGFLLSFLNDVFYVSDQDKFERAVAKIYGNSGKVEETIDLSQYNTNCEYGSINAVYKMSDGNYLINAKGTKGYKEGSVTVYTSILMNNNAVNGIGKVVITENEAQSFIGQIDNNYLSFYANNNEAVANGAYFYTKLSPNKSDNDIEHVKAGATYVSNATNNAVNCCLYFVRTQLIKGGN